MSHKYIQIPEQLAPRFRDRKHVRIPIVEGQDAPFPAPGVGENARSRAANEQLEHDLKTERDRSIHLESLAFRLYRAFVEKGGTIQELKFSDFSLELLSEVSPRARRDIEQAQSGQPETGPRRWINIPGVDDE